MPVGSPGWEALIEEQGITDGHHFIRNIDEKEHCRRVLIHFTEASKRWTDSQRSILVSRGGSLSVGKRIPSGDSSSENDFRKVESVHPFVLIEFRQLFHFIAWMSGIDALVLKSECSWFDSVFAPPCEPNKRWGHWQ